MFLDGQPWIVKATCLYFTLLSFLLVPQIQQEFIFLHRIRWPFFSAYDSPEKYGFMPNAWRSFHMNTADNVSIGATQFLPLSVQSQTLQELDNDLNATFSADVFDSALTSGRPTILYLHGNGATRLQSHRLALARHLTEALEYNVLSIDYRSFGNSERVTPSKEGVVLDAHAAWDWLTLSKGVSPNDIGVMGHSLGTAIGTQMVAELASEDIHPRAFIMSGAFSSLRELLKTYRLLKVFPFLKPLEYFSRIRNKVLDFLTVEFETASVITSTKCPLLIQHARDDVDIPAAHSRTLFGRLTEREAGLEEHNSPLIRPLGTYGTVQEGWSPDGRRVVHLDSTFGGHDVGQTSQVVMHFMRDIMQS